MSSNNQKPRLSLKAAASVPTMALIEQVRAAPSAPMQEKTMEALQEKTQVEAPAPTELTAKQMAEAEEINMVRTRALIEQQNAEPAKGPMPIIELAAGGYEELHAAMKRHGENKPKEYIPPPRTERQMSQLEEELEAGRRAQQKAQAQYDSRPILQADPHKEGFTTPVYRPDGMVPDPMTGKMGAIKT